MAPDHLSSRNVPLLVDHVKYKTQDVEAHTTDSTQGTTSFFNTCFNGLNALSGVGLLSTPYALASGGWWSFILLFLVALVAFYSGLLIQRCMSADPDIKTYPDIGQRAFGSFGRTVVSVFMYTELYLVATGFLILEGDNLHNLLPDFKLEIAGFSIDGKRSFIIIVGLVILPTVWLDDLSILAYISASGVLASATIVASIWYAGALDGVGFEQKGTPTPTNWNGIPTAVSLYAFCYCAHPVFPTLYTSMRNKRQFPNVLLVCFVCSTVLYATMAVLGYLMFGSDVESQITLNLPTEKLSSKVAIYTTLVNPISKFALMVTPIVNAAKTRFPCSYNKRRLSILIGSSLVVSTVIVALALPFFGYLMSLVGAFLSVTASLILPCLCYLKISGKSKKVGITELVLIGFIISAGFAVAIFGTWVSLQQIIGHLI